MDILGYRGDWFRVMHERTEFWDGFVCAILTEDSVSCSKINKYIEKHWENLDAISGDDLLIFAVGNPSEQWFKKEYERYDHLSNYIPSMTEKKR